MRNFQYTLDLETARHAWYAPLAEVLAVVAEQAIAVLPKTRTCATDHLVAIETRRGVRSDEEHMSVRTESQRNLLHRRP
jgi:hypothetical protein